MSRDAGGFIMYLPDGYMSAILFDPTRERFGTFDRLGGTEHQQAGAARGCIAYAGRYEIHGANVHHIVEASLMPDWVGATLMRRYKLDGQTLTLTTLPIADGGETVSAVIVWERVPESPG